MITAIVLNYKTPKATLKCVESLINHSYISNIIIVNNDVEDDSLNVSEIDVKNINIFIVHTGTNLGYAKGNNCGVNFVFNNKIVHDYILIVNSDIIVPNGFSFIPLVDKISKDPSMAIISPKIIDTNTKISQGPYFKEYILFNLIETLIPIFFFLRKQIEKRLNRQSRYVYRTMGSFLLIDSAIFKTIGFFDEKTFLGSEEQILAEKLKLIKKKFYFLADEHVLHDHGHSRKNENSKFIEKAFLDSKMYYFKTFRKSNSILLSIMHFTEKLKFFLNKFRW